MKYQLALADTSFFIATEQDRPRREVAAKYYYKVSTITIGEWWRGVLAAPDSPSTAARLRTLTKAQEIEPIPIDDSVAIAWAELRMSLHSLGRKMQINDSWIAATAIAYKLPLVTQDNDYDVVPNLEVIKL